MSYEIASPLHQQVLQRIERERQLHGDLADSTYRPLKLVTGYSPRRFIADVDEGTDAANPYAPQRLDAPGVDSHLALWHRHMRKG